MIVDHALGFRDHPVGLRNCWRRSPRSIVWQTGAPLAGSALADTLLDEHADELTVITSSDELRKTGEQVGYALSWEQLTEEILVAVRANPVSRARRVIVIVGAVGAVIVERDGEDTLVFDPRSQEGDWGKRYPGVGAAYGRCIDAAVAWGWRRPARPRWSTPSSAASPPPAPLTSQASWWTSTRGARRAVSVRRGGSGARR